MTIKPKAAQEIMDIIAERDRLREANVAMVDACEQVINASKEFRERCSKDGMLDPGESSCITSVRVALAKAKSCAPS